eukprot:CAMPEP_0170540726 /NCGR_PEP_ID=MMETSP0211-20121228/674_1 /TAXON_ID=311385 /ORGANISM="Pseudokeronopsis sp., Strain OXSARD2" /LENGTH=252 /DNA_ID=CAMNT_0010843237 /DNA_START=769 /DNA_END=1524 /DNA_ORIENTATION=-
MSDLQLTKHIKDIDNLSLDDIKFSVTPRQLQTSLTLSTNLEQTQDVVGKYIHEFKRVGEHDVPEIFILLASYFEVNPELFKTRSLFVASCCQDHLDELQIHLSLGDYYYLTEMIGEPHVAANFLKRVLNSMKEPLCTYKLYYYFRDLLEVKDDQIDKKLWKLREICAELPLINRNTFIFLIKFFQKVTAQSEFNNMDLHKLSTVITPNIFRPEVATHNDLIYAGKLVQMFKLMIENFEYIFQKVETKGIEEV